MKFLHDLRYPRYILTFPPSEKQVIEEEFGRDFLRLRPLSDGHAFDYDYNPFLIVMFFDAIRRIETRLEPKIGWFAWLQYHFDL